MADARLARRQSSSKAPVGPWWFFWASGTGLPQPRDLLEDIFQSSGELFLAIGYTAGGVPFGPRVEFVRWRARVSG
jgi:hypothetical protein